MKLGPDQESAIIKVRMRKEKYDQQLAQLDMEYGRAKEELKNPVREAVREAKELNVPVRQIHQRGLGMQQVNSMLAFLEVKQDKLASRLSQALKATLAVDGPQFERVEEQRELEVIDKGRNMWSVTDRQGDEWEFAAMGPFDGGFYVLTDDQNPLDLVDEEVIEALRKFSPGLRVGKKEILGEDWEKYEL
jgi:hypothetical protein